jgi:hypothetical protein
MHERESLIARIRLLRRTAPDPEKPVRAPTERPELARIEALEARLQHLERLVEGLQDSVHRETARQGRLITELQEQVEPGTMGAALSKDARDRGL